MMNTNNQTKTASNWWIHGLMIVAVMLIATSFPVGKVIADALPADVMMMFRFIMAAVLFAPIVFFRHGFTTPSAKSQLHYALLSLPLVTFFWCMFEALKFTSAMNTGAIFTTVPAITAIFGFLVNGDKTSFVRSIGLLIGTIGAIWIVFKGNLSALMSMELNRGDLLFFYGAIAFSIYNVFVKRVYAGEPTEVMTFWVILFGAMWLSIYSLSNLQVISWQTVSSQVYGGLFYLALFTTLVTFFLFQLGTINIGPTKVAAYGFLNPIFVLIISIFIGLAEFSPAILPGLFMVSIAMIIIQKDPKISPAA